MYYIEMLAIWRVSTPSGVVCLDSRAIWRVSTPSGVVCLDRWAILSCVIRIRTGCGGAGTHVPKINFDHGT